MNVRLPCRGKQWNPDNPNPENQTKPILIQNTIFINKNSYSQMMAINRISFINNVTQQLSNPLLNKKFKIRVQL